MAAAARSCASHCRIENAAPPRGTALQTDSRADRPAGPALRATTSDAVEHWAKRFVAPQAANCSSDRGGIYARKNSEYHASRLLETLELESLHPNLLLELFAHVRVLEDISNRLHSSLPNEVLRGWDVLLFQLGTEICLLEKLGHRAIQCPTLLRLSLWLRSSPTLSRNHFGNGAAGEPHFSYIVDVHLHCKIFIALANCPKLHAGSRFSHPLLSSHARSLTSPRDLLRILQHTH
mmetsp:Transcript_8801/g.22174  ORF Transcript_8801/g.22174 Transcript_8801/m.22174 type:complete len:235 (-) Transcript_8801:423-1127(-)